ncbi:MAG TPA: asparagine synthase-related protein [Thermoleophilaceae bacterium]
MRSLRRDGAAGAARAGPLAIASTSGVHAPAGGPLCVVDGRLDAGPLARAAGLDPALPAAELVAAAYARLGPAALDRLEGEFALAVWDERAGRGALARDRLGARPVFLAEHAGALLFASEVRNLLALLPSRPAPDETAMAHWLARAPLPRGRTLYSGIRPLPGGHALELAGGRWRERRVWRPRHAAARRLGEREAAEAVRACLGAAVERSLRGAERPAILLSGGLDSAAVAAAASAAGTRPAAYSALFPEHPEVDESQRIRSVRERLGLDGVEADLGGGSAIERAREFTREWELPSVSPNRFVWAPLLARARDDGVDVVLDGAGGDELFGCARYLVADELRRGAPLAAVRVARRLPGMGSSPPPRWIARALATYGLRAALPHRLHERLRAARGRSGGPDWLAAGVTHDRWSWKREPGPRWWAQLVHLLTSDELGVADQLRREAAIHGLELRHPLRDPALIDLVLELPPELGFDPDLDRPLLRRALAGELPDAVLREVRKPAFNPLLEAALAGPDRRGLAALLAAPPPELTALVRPGSGAFEPFEAGNRAPGRALELWRLVTLAVWLDHQGDGSA